MPTGKQGALALRTKEISRQFGSFYALTGVSMEFEFGQLVAVMGENGAGKSTLMKLVSGLDTQTSGEIELIVDGKPVDASQQDLEASVAIVPQEIELAEDRNVAQNVFMGIEPGGKVFPSRRRLESETRLLLEQIGSELKPSTRVGDLDAARKQQVLIARALARQADIIILDEPTANLSPVESEALFAVLRALKAQGKAILYVSHRIPEVFDLSDRIEVLRDGHHVGGWTTVDTSPDEVVGAMVGRNVDLTRRRTSKALPRESMVLEVDDLKGSEFGPVSFQIAEGQILGVAGLPDSGREGLLMSIYGAVAREDGVVKVNGRQTIASVKGSVKSGIAYLPGERRSAGIFPKLSVTKNIASLVVGKCTRFGLVDGRKMSKIANEHARAVNVKAPSLALPITSLSGGNQQKALIARILAPNPTVLLLDEPTRGVDVGAKAEIYDVISGLTADGKCALLSSSDLPELITQCDRILVMFRGEISAVLDASTTTEDEIMAYATLGHALT